MIYPTENDTSHVCCYLSLRIANMCECNQKPKTYKSEFETFFILPTLVKFKY